MCKIDFLICFVLGVAFSPVWSAPSFRQDQELPQIGAKIRVMSTAKPDPLVQPKTYPFTYTQGDQRWQVELFDVHEVWFFSQAVGCWRDGAGNVLLLGCPTLPFPTVANVVQDRYVQRKDYDAAVTNLPPYTAETPAEQLIPWVELFMGHKPTAVRTVSCSSFHVAAAVEFVCDAPDWIVYGFRMKRPAREGTGGSGMWTIAALKIADRTPLVRLRKDFELGFLGGLALPSVATQKAKVMTLDKQAAGVNTVNDESGGSREAAHKSIAHLKGWWAADSRDYVFLSNLKSAQGRSLIRDLQVELPALRRAFMRLVPPSVEMKDVAIVRIFEERSEYQRYIGPDLAWSIGCWSPLRRELCAVSQGENKAAKEATLKILRHEAFHQYLFYASGFMRSSLWYNEGYACFFESAEIDGQGRVSVGVNPILLDILLGDLEGTSHLLPEMITIDQMVEKLADRDLLAQRYAISWALVYFLQRAELAGKQSPYSTILAQYREAWTNTKNSAEASKQAFASISMSAFQSDFCAFWRKNGRSLRPIRIVDRP